MVGGMEGASTTPFQAGYTNVLSNIVHEPAFIIGAKNFNQRRGGVTVLSTVTGQELWLPAQRLVGGAGGDYLGASAGVGPDLFDTAGNLTGDGIPDLIVGAPQTAVPNNPSGPTGYVKMTSSAGTGSVILQGQIPNEQFGIKVGSIGNLILVTGNRSQNPIANLSLAGRIYVYRGHVAWAHATCLRGVLTDRLLEEGIQPDALAQVVQECRRDGKNLGEVLVAWDLLHPERFRDILRLHVRARVQAILAMDQPLAMFVPQHRSYSGRFTFTLAELLE